MMRVVRRPSARPQRASREAGSLRRVRTRGFTLLEVMIALAIMAVLSLLTAQALKSGIENKNFVSSEIGRDARLADTLRILRADIAQAFHYQDIFCKMANEVNSTPTPTPGPGGAPPPAVPAGPIGIGTASGAAPGSTPKPCPPDVTGFVGNENSLYFTALSNVRTIRDIQESDQAKIGYFLKSCRSSKNKGASSQCLYRAITPILDEDVDKPGPETLLLENVEEFKLRYLGPKHDDFVTSWKTGKNGDDSTRENFPYAVEITLTIHDKNNPKDRPATQTVLAPINFENNPKPKSEKTQDGTAPTPAGQSNVPSFPGKKN